MCQGLAALKFCVAEGAKGKIKATFRLVPLPENSDAPRGLYATEGACDGTTHRLKLRGWQWIDASSGDQLVDLDCVMNASGLRLAGKVPFPGCNRFELERNTPLVS